MTTAALHHARTCFYSVDFANVWANSVKLVILTRLTSVKVELWNAVNKFVCRKFHFGN